MNKSVGETAKAGARVRGGNGRYESRTEAPKKEKASRAERRLKPMQCRGHLRRELAGSFREIVQGFVEQAKSGSVQHLKLANELLGEPGTTKRRKSSAMAMLETLERMGTPEATEAGADVWDE